MKQRKEETGKSGKEIIGVIDESAILSLEENLKDITFGNYLSPTSENPTSENIAIELNSDYVRRIGTPGEVTARRRCIK